MLKGKRFQMYNKVAQMPYFRKTCSKIILFSKKITIFSVETMSKLVIFKANLDRGTAKKVL